MKTRWIGLFCIVLCLLTACDQRCGDYVPIEAFQPSYQALQGAQGDSYDIEQTVRIINALELAQATSDDFDDFLQYMARQDYSQVAQEVVDMRVKLLPVLQEMYLIDQEYEHVNLWSTLGRELSLDASQMVSEPVPSATKTDIHGLIALMSNATQLLPNNLGSAAIVNTGEKVFEQFVKNQKIKEDLSKRMHQVRKQYLEYLQEYTPVYNKYMLEWNQLCLVKDRAYLQLYSGQYQEALRTCQDALERDPDNREMLLLQSMAIIQSTDSVAAPPTLSLDAADMEAAASKRSITDPRLMVADQMLNRYIELYPTQTAPALLLQGMMHMRQGNRVEAMAYLDQAALEYPRQAEQLTDMLSSYRVRTYLNNTPEGIYLLSLYQSTMEGFGLFSPNFAKAVMHEQNGDVMMAREEIYNHFFRRSNQSVFDCILSDMEFCEDHLAFSFKQLLPENSYLDVIVSRPARMLGMGTDDNKLTVSLANRSDKILENVRIFLCVHYTDMYKTEYHVLRVPTLNRINGKQRVEVGEINLDYRDKSFNDITRIRAIALTDNTLCWIDNVYNSDINTNYNPTPTATVAELAGALSLKQRQRYFSSMNQTAATIAQTLQSATTIELETTGKVIKHQFLHIRLPRIVVMLDPSYLLNDSLLPAEDYLQGSVAHLVFKDVALLPDNQLTIKSVYASYTIHFAESNGTYSVTSVDILTP